MWLCVNNASCVKSIGFSTTKYIKTPVFYYFARKGILIKFADFMG